MNLPIASPLAPTSGVLALRALGQSLARLRAALSAVRIEVPREDGDTLVPPLIGYPYTRSARN